MVGKKVTPLMPPGSFEIRQDEQICKQAERWNLESECPVSEPAYMISLQDKKCTSPMLCRTCHVNLNKKKKIPGPGLARMPGIETSRKI